MTTQTFIATTNAGGLVGVVVIANSITGTYVVTATTKGANITITFALTNRLQQLDIYRPLIFKDVVFASGLIESPSSVEDLPERE